MPPDEPDLDLSTSQADQTATGNAHRTGYQDLFEHIPVGMYRTTPDGRILDANAALVELLGFSDKQSLLAYSAASLYLDISERETWKSLLRESDVVQSYQVRLRRLDGRVIWVEDHFRAIRDGQGRLLHYEGTLVDITQRKQAEDELKAANERLQAQLEEILRLQGQLREQTLRDPLTGLHNRRYLHETLPRELQRARRENYPVCVVMSDIDHFKAVNDTYGHMAGDLVLQRLAGYLQLRARSGDIVCRFGGEEFLLVLMNITCEDALERAEQLRSAFGAQDILYEERAIRATLSMGIAGFPRHADSGEALVGAADRALYQAKSAGRDRVVVFT